MLGISSKNNDEVEFSPPVIFQKQRKSLFDNRKVPIFESKKELQNRSFYFDDEDHSQVLQEINNVFQIDNKNLKQDLLQIKLKQLKEFCQRLSNDNKRLTKKIQQLQYQKECQSNSTTFLDEFSEMNNDFIEVQNLLKVYRGSLVEYQKTVKEEVKRKDIKIQSLNKNILTKNEQLRILASKVEQQEKQNKNYQRIICKLQRQMKTKEDISFHSERLYFSDKTRRQFISEQDNFAEQVQYEMQTLIQKLINELKHQRIIKTKIQNQIKNLKLQNISLNKRLNEKDQIIYYRESDRKKSILKESTTNKISSVSNQSLIGNYRKCRQNSQPILSTYRYSTTKSNCLRSFTVSQLINGQITITDEEKMVIVKKLIQLYEQKMNKREYYQYDPLDLLIINYNSKHLNMVSIRQNRRVKVQQGNSLARLLWNMSFNVVSLLNDVNNRLQKTQIYEITINNIIGVLEVLVKTPQQQFSIHNRYFDKLNCFLEKYFMNQNQTDKLN